MSRFKPFRTLVPLVLTLTAAGAGARPAAAAVAPAPVVTQKQYLVLTDVYYSPTATTRMALLSLTNGGTTFTGLATADPNQLLANYRAVYVPTVLSVDQYPKLRSLVVTGGVLERFVNAGGTLVLNVGGNAGSQPDIAPGGVDYNRNDIHNAEAIMTPSHPYFTGSGYGGAVLNRGNFGSWLNTDYGILDGLPQGATVLLTNTDGPSLVVYPWGRGHVIISTLSYGWAGFPARTGPAWNNLLLYGASLKPSNPISGSGNGSGGGTGGGPSIGPEKVAPQVTFSSRWPNNQLVVGPHGRAAFRIIFTDPLPSSGLAEIKIDGQNYNVVAVNGQSIAALPLPYSDTFAPGSNVTTWEVLVEKVFPQGLGSLTATVKDAAGNHSYGKR